jgi:hypothetical protein
MSAAASAAPSAASAAKWDVAKVMAYLPESFDDILEAAEDETNQSSQTTRLVQFNSAGESNIKPASEAAVGAATFKPTQTVKDVRTRMRTHLKSNATDGVALVDHDHWAAENPGKALGLDQAWGKEICAIDDMIQAKKNKSILFENLHPTKAESQGHKGARFSSDTETRDIDKKHKALLASEAEVCRSLYVATSSLPKDVKDVYQFENIPRPEKDQLRTAWRNMICTKEQYTDAFAGRMLNSNCRSVVKGADFMESLDEYSDKYDYQKIANTLDRFYRHTREFTSYAPEASSMQNLNTVAVITTAPLPTASKGRGNHK